jgi:hypothetical protein
MVKPQIIIDDFENASNNKIELPERLQKNDFYRDLSTICIIPTRGVIPAKVIQNWWGLMAPMNQKFIRMFVTGMEVGAAYTTAIEQIIANPVLRSWKYILTLEEDNMPPPDGLLKLYEGMEQFDVVGGLYWTKGDMGQPMIYGDPSLPELNFIPQVPLPETIQQTNGLGMGFNLYKLDIFRDPRVPRPYFKTVQEFTPYVGGRGYSQDLYFYENIKKLGYKVACDTRIKVGHFDYENDIVW